MTTSVHIVNLGPSMIEVDTYNPLDDNLTAQSKTLYSQESINLYVYDNQSIDVSEKPIVT